MGKTRELPSQAVDRLDLSPEVKEALSEVQAEIAAAYRDSFIGLTAALTRQASALDRIQATLSVIVKSVAPQLEANVPTAIRVAQDGEHPDIASAVLTADPIGAGFTLSLAALAQAVGCNAPDASILVRAFKMSDDASCAVVVRQGAKKNSRIVNYHPRAVDKFLEHLDAPPVKLTADAQSAWKRACKAVAARGRTTKSKRAGS